MASELIALAVGGGDPGTVMRQITYNRCNWPHIEFDDMDSFMRQVLEHTGVWHKKTPAQRGGPKPENRPAPPQPPPIQPLSILTILTHGGFDGPIMGSGAGDTLTRARILGRSQPLKAMRKCFHPQGEVVFGGCLVGLNPWLLADLAEIWGVKVTGYTTLQTLGNPFYSGEKVTVLPNRKLIAGRDTQCGKEFLKHPYDRVKIPNFLMGDTASPDDEPKSKEEWPKLLPGVR